MIKNNLRLFKKGFTLIELLVVISIIGVLTTLIVTNLQNARARARDTKKKQNLTQLKTALRLYYNDYQSYPLPTTQSETLNGCGTNGNEACTTTFSAGSGPTIYMKELPEFTFYQQTDSGDGFRLYVDLENASDPDIASTQIKCLGAIANPATTNFYVCTD